MKKNSLFLCTLAALALAGCNDQVEWESKVNTVCGNGVLEAGEQCDTTARVDCSYYDSKQTWVSGKPGCSADCKLTKGTCVASGQPPVQTCGNGVVDSGESCDGSVPSTVSCADVKGEGATGTVACTGCQFDYSACQEAVKPETCGNGTLDDGEECDGDESITKTCVDYAGEGATGTLTCNSNCKIVSSACEGVNNCGNGTIDDGEECDGNDSITKTCVDYAGEGATGTLTCDSECKIVSSACEAAAICGDNIINGDDECDGDESITKTCADYEGTGATGELSCDSECKIVSSECKPAETPENCGNGTLDDGEECDGDGAWSDNVEKVCNDGDKLIDPNAVKCHENCTIDKAASCKSACNDGVLDDGEVCDSDNFNGATCASVLDVPETAATGSLTCSSTCTIDESGCGKLPYCGDGEVTDGEDCDGTNLNEQTCKTLDPTKDGTLSCDADCKFDTTKCSYVAECNNGQIDTGEECDKENLNDKSCSDALGKPATGTLACDSTCHFNVEGCTPICGNGAIDGEEECDMTELNGATCSSILGVPASGTPTCTTECKIDSEACEPLCGNGAIDGEEECDKTELKGATCSSILGVPASGAPVCTTECKIDSEACKPLCGNGVIDGDEVCDGTAFADGAKATCAEGSAQVSLVCAAAGCVIDNDASCAVIPATCNNSTMDAGEVCDVSMPEYTALACATEADFVKDYYGSNNLGLGKLEKVWVGTNSCSAACSLDSSKCAVLTAEDMTFTPVRTNLNRKTINASGAFNTLRFAREGYFVDGISVNYDAQNTETNPNGTNLHDFGPWTKATNNVPYLGKYLKLDLTVIKDDPANTSYSLLAQDFDYISVAVLTCRVSSTSITSMAMMLYDGDTLVSKLADIVPGEFPNHLTNTGEIVFSIKGMTKPNVRFVNTDPDHTGNVRMQDLRVSGIKLK